MNQNREAKNQSSEQISDSLPETNNHHDVQIETTEMPDGSVLYSAEDGENVISVFASKDKGCKVFINGQETSNTEDLEKVSELFQLDLTHPDIANIGGVDTETSHVIGNETNQIKQEVRQALEKEGVAVPDEMFKRRVSQMMEGMDETNVEDMTSQNVIDFATNREQIVKVKRASLAESIGKDGATVDALANKIAESGDVATANALRQRAYEMQTKIGGVKDAENSDMSVQEFGRSIEKAMSIAKIEDIEQLQSEVENDKTEEKAA